MDKPKASFQGAMERPEAVTPEEFKTAYTMRAIGE